MMASTAPIWTRAYWSAYLLWHLRQQAPVPYLPLDELAARRDRRVRAMVAYAYRWAPHYRETMQRLGLTPDDFRCADDLRRLPPIEVRALQREPERFRSSQFREQDLLRVGSGGSTGETHYVWHDTAALFQSAAHSQRDLVIATALIGRSRNYRHVSLGSPRSTAVEVRHFTRQKAIYPSREPVQRLTLSLADPPEVNLPRMNDFRPDFITGYGSYFGRLCSYVRDSGAPFHRPKVIVYSSEGVPEAARRIITTEFGIPLFGLYQAIEAFKMGFECEAHRGYHINMDNYVLRVVNDEGEDVAPGETGEVLVSNLVNRGTVLLNMRLGDMARWLPAGAVPLWAHAAAARLCAGALAGMDQAAQWRDGASATHHAGAVCAG